VSAPVETSPQEVTVRRLGEAGSEMAVFEFQGELREQIVASLQEGFLATGRYLPDAKLVSPQTASSVAFAGVAGGAAVWSASMAPTLYIATANPSTLMSLGNAGGVGSAVMGSSGIVGQAPFLPVASSLPVVAPLLAIQALNTALMMQQFKQVDKKLDAIKSTLDRAIARAEATHAGELLAASRVVDEVYQQYEVEGEFSTDMLVRLSLAERDVRSLAARFVQLVEAQDETKVDDILELRHSNYDAHSAMLASFLDLRVAYLRVCVDMQENPRSVELGIEHLKGRIDEGVELWQKLIKRSQKLKERIGDLESKRQDMNWADRNLPRVLGGEGSSNEKNLERLRAAYLSTLESEREIMEGFDALVSSAKTTRRELDELPHAQAQASTLVYWEDANGKHSFVTNENLVA